MVIGHGIKEASSAQVVCAENALPRRASGKRCRMESEATRRRVDHALRTLQVLRRLACRPSIQEKKAGDQGETESNPLMSQFKQPC